jgi:hypothetical protein
VSGLLSTNGLAKRARKRWDAANLEPITLRGLLEAMLAVVGAHRRPGPLLYTGPVPRERWPSG